MTFAQTLEWMAHNLVEMQQTTERPVVLSVERARAQINDLNNMCQMVEAVSAECRALVESLEAKLR